MREIEGQGLGDSSGHISDPLPPLLESRSPLETLHTIPDIQSPLDSSPPISKNKEDEQNQ